MRMRMKMKMNLWKTLCLTALLAMTVTAAAAQPATLSNAATRVHSAASGLQATLEELTRQIEDTAWVGWQVPALGDVRACCWSSGNGSGRHCGCRLEGGQGMNHARSGVAREGVALTESPNLLVLLHVEAHVLNRVRFFSGGCPVDAGSAKVHWLHGVKPTESVGALARLAQKVEEEGGSRRLGEGALAALAYHADPAADAALGSLVRPGRSKWVRRQAAFWMGQARGTQGLDTVLRLLRGDADDPFRQHLTFVVSQSEETRALDALIDVARNDRSQRVRGQALFWLAQKASHRAVATIADAVQSDPDTAIKKKAVFALSQLPVNEGVPLLIKTARSHDNREVRKQAMFWLGQSNDARALAFIEQILTR